MRAAIYARYSSSLQTAASIDDQIRLCREHAAKQRWTVVHVYSDAAVSGATILRPGLQGALAAARDGSIDIIIAEALDRISRDQEDVAGIYKRLSFAGVALVTLSEGEIGALHVGLKGTMNAIFLKDLADKTRRGMRGKLESGKAVAGLSYGYRVTAVGERSIDEGEATIVRRIFIEYDQGLSPRQIAKRLNAAAVPGPGGRLWGPSTVVGNRHRGLGVINNEIYIGTMVWNRQRFVKDPDSRKRQARANPRDAWVRVPAPHLRIVDDDIWQRVKERQGAYEHKPLSGRRRPKHFLSGLIKCASCGGGMSAINQTQFGCSTAHDRGTCPDPARINKKELERRILTALECNLVRPEAFAAFCETFTRVMNERRREQAVSIRGREADLAKVTRELDRFVDALAQGVPADRVRERMVELEERRAVLLAQSGQEEAPGPYLHPNMAEVYRRKVSELAASLSGEQTAAAKARETLRSLIDRIVITMAPEGPSVDLIGDLAGILNVASAGAIRGSTVAGGPKESRVAGHRTSLFLGQERISFRASA
ncbi:MAG: hypothetical protein A3E01_10015 [Gammaproteobacteria bacterium RIFCSPHIGHO2_12_FULL_63_22]|nr:MAG: hypothetical protein A3E01_10015 [Gammaproteobacteria bacterium RIFCSPHIGHO2_12_FULL_63_22]